MKETDLASIVVWWLNEFDWEVYQEVDYGPVIDIVATRGPLLRVIECKTSFSAALVEQAYRHLPYAHMVHIATPLLRRAKGRMVMERACKHFGIGLLEASEQRYGAWRGEKEEIQRKVLELSRCRFNRKARVDYIRKKLCERQKTYAPAGNSDGLRYTPWKGTCERWRDYVQKHPGCTLADIIRDETHHYASDSSARCNMVKWIEVGKVPGIRIERGRCIRLYSEE